MEKSRFLRFPYFFFAVVSPTNPHFYLQMLAKAALESQQIASSGAQGRTNLTIVFMNAYARIAEYQPLVDLVVPDLYAGIYSEMDASAQMAVDEINARADVLSNAWIHVRRVEGDDPRILMKNGAVAAVSMLEVVTELLGNSGAGNILGVVNFGSDFSSRIAAQIGSSANILMCHPLTEDIKYFKGALCPTCFGSIADVSRLAESVVAYLKHLGVRRVAVLYEELMYDELRESLRALLPKSNIQTIAFVRTPISYTKNDLQSVYSLLRAADARYIITIMEPAKIADVYFFAREFSLVSPSHVWVSFTPPIATGPIPLLYGPDAPEDLEGFVYVHFEAQLQSAPRVIEFSDAYLRRNKEDPSWFVTSGGTVPVFAANSYDCANMIMYGYDRLMRTQNISVEDVAAGRFRIQNAKKFASGLDYEGVTVQNLTLDDDGFLQQNAIFFNINISTIYAAYVDRESGFGGVGFQPGSPFVQYRPQIFYGGSTVPPHDGSFDQTIVTIEPNSAVGVAIITVTALGVLASVFAFGLVLLFRNDRVFVSTSVGFGLAQAAGLGFVFAAGCFFLGEATSNGCHVRTWLQLVGFAVLAASAVAKNAKLFFLLKPSRIMGSKGALEWVLFGGIILVEVALLLGWSLSQNPQAVLLETPRTQTKACLSSPSGRFPGKAILYTFNLFLLAAVIQVTRAVRWNESRYSDSAVDNSATLAAAAVAVVAAAAALPAIEFADVESRAAAAPDATRAIAAETAAAAALVALFATKAAAVAAKLRARRAARTPSMPLAMLRLPSQLRTSSFGRRGDDAPIAVARASAPAPAGQSSASAQGRWTPQARSVRVVDLGTFAFKPSPPSPLTPWRAASASYLPDAGLLLLDPHNPDAADAAFATRLVASTAAAGDAACAPRVRGSVVFVAAACLLQARDSAAAEALARSLKAEVRAGDHAERR
ncbi:periplasmic binding protein-like I [Zopfochytrium polystomum]|nr:periplasmic binding protein-like I [Zopfochytrium polystomum]